MNSTASPLHPSTILPIVPPQRLWIGWALGVSASLFFSFAPPIARHIIKTGVDATALVALRLWLATLFIGLTIAVWDRSLLRIDRRGLLIACLAGIINGVGMLLFFLALERVDASMASMMISLSPLMVLSLLWLRGERFTYRHAVRAVLGLSGVYLLIGPTGFLSGHLGGIQADVLGVVLLLVATVCFSSQMALLQWYLRDYDARTLSLYLSLMMAITVTAYWLARGASWPVMTTGNWLWLLVLAFVCTYLSRLSMLNAIGLIGSGQMSMLAPIETLLTVIWSMLFLDERLTPVQWVGGALIMTSALLAIQRLGRAQWRPRWRLWSRA